MENRLGMAKKGHHRFRTIEGVKNGLPVGDATRKSELDVDALLFEFEHKAKVQRIDTSIRSSLTLSVKQDIKKALHNK